MTSDEEGGTPGHPGIDYPILTVIPPTKFNCKTQRYKGFFADPETRCQVSSQNGFCFLLLFKITDINIRNKFSGMALL